MYFEHESLLKPPIARAAYSDRTAWLMAEMSRLAYAKFEQKPALLQGGLAEAGFESIATFNTGGTQAFLAKRQSDCMAVLAFRGTEQDDPRDIQADLSARFFHDEHGVRVHDGFYKAFQAVQKEIVAAVAQVQDCALYLTGHSFGGALALVAARVLSGDNIAACYTFGSPKVGAEDFDDDIKPPIYRIVNAYDAVPFLPPTELIDILLLIPKAGWRAALQAYRGYAHHGDVRFLARCREDFEGLDVIANYNDWRRLLESWSYRKQAIADHAVELYSKKLACWALKRLNLK